MRPRRWDHQTKIFLNKNHIVFLKIASAKNFLPKVLQIGFYCYAGVSLTIVGQIWKITKNCNFLA
jgi:hypothetical protein